MAMINKPRLHEMDVEIQDAISVQTKGTEVKATRILIKAPSAKNRREAFAMKQIFSRAVAAMTSNMTPEQIAASQENANKNKKSETTGEEIIAMILGSSENFDAFNDQFQKLICHGCAFIEGEQLNMYLYEQLSLEDAEHLLAQYLQHFLMKSLIQ